LIGYGKQKIDSKDINEVLKVLKSDTITQGKTILKFEESLKKKFGAKYCSVVSNGTAALHLAGIALNWKKGDIILTSPISFLASANCILYSNAIADFVDIDNKTYTIDLNKTEEKIKRYIKIGKKIKTIIGVDYAGHPCDWKSLKFLSNKYNITLINDNCHALGSSYKGSTKYANKYAHIVTQSFHPVKAITTGEGGAVMSQDSKLNNIINNYRNHGIERDINQIAKKGLWYYRMKNLGYNYRITDFQCALGISQLSKLNNFIKKRNNIAEKYNYYLKDIDFLTIPYVDSEVKHSYHLYPLKINFNKIKINKRNFFINMKKSGINLQVHYIPIHLQPYYKNKFKYHRGELKNSELFYKSQCSLPIYPSLSNKDQKFIIKELIKILK